MKLHYLILFLFLALCALSQGQVNLEKPANETPPPSAPATAPEPAPAAPAPAPPAMPLPPPSDPPPESKNPFGLLVLAVILAHVCLPVGVLIALILVMILLRVFKGGIMKLVVALATGGGAQAIKKVLGFLGILIVVPAGFLGLNWASKWSDHRVEGPTFMVYGVLVAFLTGFVFFTIMRAVATALKKRFLGKGMAGMMKGMGGMGGMGGLGGLEGMLGGGDRGDRDRRGGKGGKRRR